MAADTADLVTTTAAPMTGARFIVLLMAALSVSMAYGVTLPGVPLISMQFATVSTFNAHKGYFK